ncbi:serine hydrolase domain-containing protein [Stigmatella aurantiaca]|nr:serine hydrolase domain-containing protein [Stigmatella aurantiaca]ADO75395.1 Beta-lactamase family protein [Stigmatella aurantiaca DW4/3-1]
MTWSLVGMLAVAVLAAPAVHAAPRQQELDRLVAKYHELRQFNGAVLVADGKGVVLKKGYGFANFEWREPNTPDTKFRIGSITKQFTAMVIMQLVNEGKLKLDDTVSMYLPDYRKDTGTRVTVTQLLNHTSGIPSYTSAPGFFDKQARNPAKVAEFVKEHASGDLEFEPGTKWAYNNSGYFLLGAIIEKVTGKPYAQVVRERIFEPLGMKNSGYDLHATVLPKRASGYELKPEEGYVNAPYLDMSLPYAAGSLYSTVEDLFLWDRALYLDTLLPEPLKKKMFTPGMSEYAFGWLVKPVMLNDGKTEVATVHHGGGINGFSAFFVRVPERKEVVVLLDNTSRGDKIQELAAGLLSILHGIAPQPPRPEVGETLRAILAKAPVAEAVARYRDLKATKADAYDFSEGQLNRVGYWLLKEGRVPDAIEVFKLNVEMFPASGNPYDSLGEAYLAGGDLERAKASYRKALELDPSNRGAEAALQQLQAPVGAPAAKPTP